MENGRADGIDGSRDEGDGRANVDDGRRNMKDGERNGAEGWALINNWRRNAGKSDGKGCVDQDDMRLYPR
jgi:hypothetical protein